MNCTKVLYRYEHGLLLRTELERASSCEMLNKLVHKIYYISSFDVFILFNVVKFRSPNYRCTKNIDLFFRNQLGTIK